MSKLKKAVRLLKRIIYIPREFSALAAGKPARFNMRWRDRLLCLRDATAGTGFDRHYVYHTAWASRILAETRPSEHIDISSSLYFVANVSAFVPTRFYDFRPANLRLNGLSCERGDLHALPFKSGSVRSLSCMHVIEHIGLGRYGDPIDYQGDIKAASELMRVLATGGRLLIVVPIGGRAVLRFNAHRIYTYQQVVSLFSGLRLEEFALIPNDERDGGLNRSATEIDANREDYGCGCFVFIRP